MDEAAFPRWMPAQLAARLARYAGAKGRHDLVLRLLGRGSVASLPVKARAVLAHSLAETARFSDLDALIGAVAVQSSSERLRSIAQALDEAADCGWQTQSAVRLIQYAEPARDKDGGHGMPIPYHAATLGAVEIPGLRDPSARLRAIPIDFTDKSVLDLGSCFGGFLFPLRDRLRWGVGVDNNPRYINVCQKLRAIDRAWNLDFYFHDIEKQPFQLVRHLMPEPAVDVALLLRVFADGSLSEVLTELSKFSQTIVFEPVISHWAAEQDLRTLRALFRSVAVIEIDIVEPLDGGRHTLYCATDPIR